MLVESNSMSVTSITVEEEVVSVPGSGSEWGVLVKDPLLEVVGGSRRG